MSSLEITTRIGCRVNCLYCPQNILMGAYRKKFGQQTLLSFQDFMRCIQSVPKSVNIHFTGMCEPFLNPHCADMILYAYQRGHGVTVSTTLVGMSENDFDKISEVEYDTFWLHLPSSDGLENIRIDEGYLSLLKKIISSNITLKPHFHGVGLHQKIKSLIDGVPRVLVNSRAQRLFSGEGVKRKNRGVIRCYRNLRSNVMLPNGVVVLCCNDYSLDHVLGNLLDTPYSDLFNGEEFKEVQIGLCDESSNIICRYCDIDIKENTKNIRSAVANLLGRKIPVAIVES